MLIGVDWGGTKIEVVALSPDGVRGAHRREATPRGDYRACLDVIALLVEQVQGEVGRVDRVGVGIPGSIDPTTGLGKGASSTWLMDQPVERDLQEAMGREVVVENDVDVLAVSEARDGAGAGYDVVFVANLASGVGGALAVGGRPHYGPNKSVGEWGHNPLPFPSDDELPGPACYCGKRGCMETWASGRAFEAQYEDAAGSWLHGSEIATRARGGDDIASKLLDRYIDRVARGLSIVANTIDPDVFVLSGGMSNVDDLYRVLPGSISRYVFSSVFTTPLRKMQHRDSCARGAAWLVAE
jgi:fructokinase